MRVDQPLLRRSAPLSLQGRYEEDQPLVIIVDDDASVREALSELILSAGFQSVSFASTRELLDADILENPPTGLTPTALREPTRRHRR